VETTTVSSGKLVRDRIPEVIRSAGGDPKTRRLDSDEMADALAAKLIEEATEAAAAVHDRDELVQELADLHEVQAAIMDHFGLSWDEVVKAAERKRLERGGFTAGVWLEA
jgi:predicted house-cleaning noncanonical NTP pyrophosphatase (MazG superfamily)